MIKYIIYISFFIYKDTSFYIIFNLEDSFKVSICVEQEIFIPKINLSKVVGIDVGIKLYMKEAVELQLF